MKKLLLVLGLMAAFAGQSFAGESCLSFPCPPGSKAAQVSCMNPRGNCPCICVAIISQSPQKIIKK